MIRQISDNTGHKNQEMGSNGFLNKTRFLHFYSTQSWGNYHQQVDLLRKRRKGHKLSSLFYFYLVRIHFQSQTVDMQATKSLKLSTFYVPSFWIVFPSGVYFESYIFCNKKTSDK